LNYGAAMPAATCLPKSVKFPLLSTTLPAEAALPRAIPPRLLRLVGLLSLRRRQAGIVRRLRRLGELRLQLGDPTLCRVQPLPQRQDQRILLGVAQLAEVGQYAHAKLESSCP
jgi:hypothetical protein